MMTQAFHDGPTASRRGSGRATVLLSVCLVLNLATVMTFAATLNEIAVDWSLNAAQSGWIGGIYFAGYAIAVPFSTSATDRMDGRWLYLCSALLGSAASFALAAFGHGFVVAVALRFLGGIGLAGIHMPGLNMLMDRVEHSYQGRAAGIYTSSYAAGSAGSFLIAGVVDQAFGWRATFIIAGIGPLLSISVLSLTAGALSQSQIQPTTAALSSAPAQSQLARLCRGVRRKYLGGFRGTCLVCRLSRLAPSPSHQSHNFAAARGDLRRGLSGGRSGEHGDGRGRGAARVPPGSYRRLFGLCRGMYGAFCDRRRVSPGRPATPDPRSDHEFCRCGRACRRRSCGCRSDAARGRARAIRNCRLHDWLSRPRRSRPRTGLVWRF